MSARVPLPWGAAIADEIDKQGAIWRWIPLHDDNLGRHLVAIELADEKAKGTLDALDIAFHVAVVAHPSDDA